MARSLVVASPLPPPRDRQRSSGRSDAPIHLTIPCAFFMRIRFSIIRMLIGFALFAGALALFQDSQGIGSIAGLVLGSGLLGLALVAERSDIAIIVRCYVLSGVWAFIGAMFAPVTSSHMGWPPVGFILVGALAGWVCAVLITAESRQTVRKKRHASQDREA